MLRKVKTRSTKHEQIRGVGVQVELTVRRSGHILGISRPEIISEGGQVALQQHDDYVSHNVSCITHASPVIIRKYFISWTDPTAISQDSSILIA